MKRALFQCLFVLGLSFAVAASAASALIPPKSNAPELQGFEPKPAPQPNKLLLKKGDRLAIVGDSITEQKMYSRIIETYLTVCVPELHVTTRQYGWSGEQASGFLARMTNDCLRFQPTIATTCYGMNDHRYQPYTEEIGANYRRYSAAVIDAFKAHGVRVVHGSPGPVGKMPSWVKTANGTVRDLNLSLCQLRNIGVELAEQKKVGFADVFWPMINAGVDGQQRYGTNFAIAGKDGVHPGWAGQTVMAHAFLKALGLDGEIGTVTVDLGRAKAKASHGHSVISCKPGEVQIKSTRYPFCATGATNDDGSIRAAMTLIPFNQELNRFILVAKNGKAANYKVTWGPESHTYPAAQLAAGVNLANDFVTNAFSEAFTKVNKAVTEKQVFETKQIKEIFHGLGKYKSAEEIKDPVVRRFHRTPEQGKWNKDELAAETETLRAPLVQAVKEAFVPLTHAIVIEPVP